MAKAGQFARGSGVYVCRSCGRSTRATGRGDNENIRLCADCYDLGGIENAISDGGATDNDIADGVRLYLAIKSKGGSYTLSYPNLFFPSALED